MKPKSCLVIDDDEDSLFITQHSLEKLQLRAFTATSLQEGEKLYDALCPDIVIIEWHEPFIHAPDLLRSLSERDRQKARVIVSSAEDSAELREAALKHGADYFLCKPYAIEALRQLCHSFSAPATV